MLPVVAAGKVALHNTLLDAGKKKADLARMLNRLKTPSFKQRHDLKPPDIHQSLVRDLQLGDDRQRQK